MPASAILAIVFGSVCALGGCLMVFRPAILRRWLGRQHDLGSDDPAPGNDPVAYGMRIAGSMLFTFGIALAVLFYLFYHS